MEVYNEYVIVLLPAQQDMIGAPYSRTPLKVRDHPKKGVFVQGMRIRAAQVLRCRVTTSLTLTHGRVIEMRYFEKSH